MNSPAMADTRTQEQQVDSSHTQLDIDHPTREQMLQEQIDSLQVQTQTPTRKNQELKDLTDGFQANLIQKNGELDEVRQKWKQTAKELGKYQTKDKVVDQVTDPEITQKARQIQYNVRNFAYQHFGGELNIRRSVEESWQYLQSKLQTPTVFFEACVNSSAKRPMLVVAFLWAFLVKDVFERFMWCGKGLHHHMENLTAELSERSHVASSLNDADKVDQSPAEATGPRQNADIRCGKPTLAPSWWMRWKLTEKKGRI